MELNKLTQKLSGIIKKYRYVILVVVIGLILMAIPTTKTDSSQATTEAAPDAKCNLEERLSSILSLVDGAGEVHVLLTIAEGEEIIYQTNEDYNSTDSEQTSRLDTVTITAADRSADGLVRQIIPETFQGAVVICSGANDPVVRLAIVDAVSKLTGLGANQISVLKMK